MITILDIKVEEIRSTHMSLGTSFECKVKLSDNAGHKWDKMIFKVSDNLKNPNEGGGNRMRFSREAIDDLVKVIWAN